MNIISALIALRNSESKAIFAIREILYFFLKLIPKNTVVPILLGKLKGKKWIIGSALSAFWLGTYEYEKQLLFYRIIRKGAVVYDIGAHTGFHTLLASSLAGPAGKVFAFEPSPRNVRYLRKHLEINHCDNVTVIEAAVAEEDGSAFLEEDQEYTVGLTGRLSAKAGRKVKKVSLDNLVLEGVIPPPEYMKIDVEGAELQVLFGAKKILSDSPPVIFLSTHGVDIHNQCCAFLTSLNYLLEPIDGSKYIATRRELLGFTPLESCDIYGVVKTTCPHKASL